MKKEKEIQDKLNRVNTFLESGDDEGVYIRAAMRSKLYVEKDILEWVLDIKNKKPEKQEVDYG